MDMAAGCPRLRQRQWARNSAAAACRLKTEGQRAIERTEKTRDALHIEDVRELIDRARGRFRAEGLIGHLHERRHIAGRLQHPVQLGLLPSLRRRLHFRGALLERPRECDRALDEIGIEVGAHTRRV